MEIYKKFILAEKKRQNETICLIASENYASDNVLESLGSCLTNKYAEGYPYKRYYAGNKVIDDVELWCKKEALKAFNLSDADWHVNVQPYSGSPANLAIYLGLLKPGDRIMGMKLSHGGHLTHGHKVSFTGKLFDFGYYGVNQDGLIDYDLVEKEVLEFKPKLLVVGATAYSRILDFARFRKIADSVGAYLLADISHIAGLIAAGLHPTCFEDADIVMTTTHKTLRGPRGAVIFCRKKYAEKIDKAVFPGMQGGPHMNVILAKGVAFVEAQKTSFINYQKKVIENATCLAGELKKNGLKIVTGGTDNHLFLLDLSDRKYGARYYQDLLEEVGIVVNRNTIPYDQRSPLDPSGIRLGTPAVTTRGMGTNEMKKIANWITEVCRLDYDKKNLFTIGKQVMSLTSKFPIE